MVGIRKHQALAFFLLSGSGLALQVSPNSPCAAKCLDNPNQDLSTPTLLSETSGADLVCTDSDYNNTAIGKRYQDCMNCLHTSPFSAQNQNDQEWFLYNLRFTAAACLFGFVNTTDSVSSPCTTDTNCGPLQSVLEDGNLIPGNGSEFSYCTADDNAFRGGYLPNCIECLRSTSDQRYLANFLTALDAGCEQLPKVGLIIGLEGNVFSSVPVNGTFAGYHQNSTSTANTSHHHGLSQGGIIGITVALIVLAIIAAAICFICFRKRQGRKQLQALHSPLDARFGADNITSPVDGGYGNPYSRNYNQATQPFNREALSKKELTALTNARSVIAKHEADPLEKLPSGWQDAHAHLANKVPAYMGAAIPTHQAYIPTPKRDSSQSGTTVTDNSYQLSKYPSSRSSPKDIVSPSPHSSPRDTTTSTRPSPKAVFPTSTHVSPNSVLRPIQVSENNQSSATQFQPQAHVQLSQTSPEFEESSRFTLRSMHSQNSQSPDPRPPSRTLSRAGNWRRGTTGYGIGNSNASSEAPVQISGPIIKHGGRFDFEMADRERLFKERQSQQHIELQRRKDATTPDSVDTEELWPGAY